jgi:hypothetical protein
MSPAFLLALVACVADPREGTAVGNPTNMTMEVGAASDAKLSAASVVVDSTWALDCAGDAVELPVERAVDLLAGDAVPVPSGTLCGVRVAFGSALRLALVGATEQVAVSLPIGVMELRTAEAVVTPGDWALRLGDAGWIDVASARAAALGEPDAADALVRRMLEGVTLSVDADMDGAADSDGEVSSGATSGDVPVDADDDDDDAGAEANDHAGNGRAATPGAPGRANGVGRANGDGGNGNGRGRTK